MARQKYTIEKKDFQFVRKYLERKLIQFCWPNERPSEAKDKFENNKCDNLTLNVWCEKWLDKEQWGQLKNAVRAHRSHQKRKSKLRTIRLSSKAHLILSDLSKHDNITLSEVVLKHLEKRWEKVLTGE